MIVKLKQVVCDNDLWKGAFYLLNQILFLVPAANILYFTGCHLHFPQLRVQLAGTQTE